MNLCCIRYSPGKQRGAATLFIAVIMLVAMTLVTLLSSKTVINETKIAANNYRTTQAVAAANYAMDLGVNYFNTGGFDRFDETTPGTVKVGGDDVTDVVIDIDGDGTSDGNMDDLSLTSTDGNQTISAILSFDNTGCGAAGLDMKSGEITATGYSDDGMAMRRVFQCVGPLKVLRNNGPKQPLVAQGQVALTGNAQIVNRFTSTTIWAGDQVTISSSSAMETYIRSVNLSPVSSSGDDALDPADLTPITGDRVRLLATDEEADTQMISNKKLGNGLDIIDEDSSLGTLVGIEFLKNFFYANSRPALKLQAGGQVYNDIDDVPSEQSGLIWIEKGTSPMTGGTIGTVDNPATVYVNGDFMLAGNATIYGVLYVAGVYTISGSPVVVGANIVEGTNFSGGTETLASPPIVKGHGAISLIYWAGPGASGTNNGDGETAVISGSWHDWSF